MLEASDFVDWLATASFGEARNVYAGEGGAARRRRRLVEYLGARRHASLLLVGEAYGYRGAAVSGIPFTSERQLTGSGPAEATATIVHRVLEELGLEQEALLWNVVPAHPHLPGRPRSNRRPSRAEVEAGRRVLRLLVPGRRVVAIGRVAGDALSQPALRHPSHGGASAFRDGLERVLAWRLSPSPC